jgi:hypothetical protein
MLHNIKSIDGAIKAAAFFHLPALAERISFMKEVFNF